jgi:hypothetical protein
VVTRVVVLWFDRGLEKGVEPKNHRAFTPSKTVVAPSLSKATRVSRSVATAPFLVLV